MCVEQLLLVLPTAADPTTGHELTGYQWGALVDDFAAQGGHELILGGAEPLGYPGFWQLVRRGQKARIPRITAYLNGGLLEPWVVRALVERHVHALIALDSPDREIHDQLHGAGSHARALAALDLFIKQGLEQRTGILATVTRLNHEQLPALGAWAAGLGLARCLWRCMPDGDWPSTQLRALRLSPQEKIAVANAMQTRAPRLLRVEARGEAFWGFSGAGGRAGNLKVERLKHFQDRLIPAAGD
ncbi:MAG: radical additional 4Fe4S-binding domain protein [Firmicutes bacterium]|nr:radical additional 4Fe4S-binding domain protein [Bacillota bacterium]